MSRWGRGRGGSVAVPLDSALFRENTNCPSAARSAGTVGKWGITSFTSIRSAPYAYNNVAKKSVQDQNSPLTVPAVETEQAPPKPKKFFKSRNVEAFPPVPQISYAPPESAAPLSPDPSYAKEKKKRSKAYNRDSSSPEAPRYKGSEKGKSRKNSVSTKASKKEEPGDDESKPPNKRYLVRNRNKVINYAEDGSNSPIPDFARYESVLPPKAPPSPKPSSSVTSPTHVKPGLVSPSSKEGSEDRKPPPIVLRISKGTSRIVSTDSNEGLTSPGSDRHSSMDMHSDYTPELKKSPPMDTIASPKHEGLKITIKCSALNQESSKKEKKKDKKESHKAHKRHHKNSDDEPLKKPSSPQQVSDTYDMYKTLASPEKDDPPMDEIESKLAELDSDPPIKSPRLEVPTEPPPEPKPPERSSGRARRNRRNINYSENDDYLDAITSKKIIIKPIPKPIPEPKKETRRTRRKNEAQVLDTPVEVAGQDNEPEKESHIENNDLLDILSGNSDTGSKPEIVPLKLKVSKKQKKSNNKRLSPKDDKDTVDEESKPVEETMPAEPDVAGKDDTDENLEQVQPESNSYQSSMSPPVATDNVTNDVVEEDTPKTPDEVFKHPHEVIEEAIPEDKPSVKLVITKKKGSIFKSKSLVNDNQSSPLPARKRRHLYKHEWANDKGNETPRSEPEQQDNAETSNTTNEVSDELTRVTRYRAPDPILDDLDADVVKPYTSVKCAKEAKEYYTVVRNVKKAHQIQEIGEFQEFNDDVEYLLDALQDNNPISTRCLSAITLASKCTAPAFRMHLRAHGTVQKFFSALHDATNDQSLGLCTATVMFVLSQDRLNMDLDRESLELMLNLLESDVSHKNALDACGLTSAQLTKTQERVRELCAEIKNQGKAKHLDLENITVGHLAMETLLSLTSKRAGEWFKEELRVLGGVDHIVRTIQECVRRLIPPVTDWSSADVDVLRKADRCMRVLENITQQNEENQLYLVSGDRKDVSRTLTSLLSLCTNEARLGTVPSVQGALLDAALPAIKVLVNLSHSFGLTASLGASVVGEVDVMETCLVILNNQGNFVPDDRNFEFSVCVLLLLINLVQNNQTNTERLLNIRIRVDNDEDIMAARVPALDLIVELFYKRAELAKRAEENTDALLDGEKQSEVDKDKKKQSQDDIDETVAKLLARAGTHMEHTMVGAYTALLLGHIAAQAPSLAAVVRERVPSYQPLLPTLLKYYNFLALTASAEATIVAHVKATDRIIKFMESSDREHSQEDTDPPASHQVNVAHYYQTSPSDMPQDMSINNLTYNSINYSSSGSDRMSSSMEIDSYH